MLGAIIGDIVGSRLEFGPAPEEGFGLFTDDCTFTDDTVCTIAVADAVLNGKSYKDASWSGASAILTQRVATGHVSTTGYP